MLVLSRKAGQRLVIGDNITIIVQRIAGNRVQIGIEAPDDVHIMRGELDKIRRQFSEDVQDESTTPTTVGILPEFASATEITSRSLH